MKTISKIFMAVVAGVLAFSCVTDTTEDLGVNLGEGQTTTISIALDDEARTYIGEADGNSYPMYWSEGDQITVNGHTSLALTAEDINGNNATFTIPAVLEGDYCVTYPAAAEGQVKFVAEQTHKDNSTFGDGVTTMYGYGESGNLTLKPLTGILKVGVTGSAKLTKAQISTTGNPIAGDFDIDFATGKVAPTSNATNVITYSFGDSGLQLTDAEQYMHIAVPAGEYNYLHITLFDSEGKVMVANVKADSSKPLTAGYMRIFGTPITYAPNSTDFYIADYNDLVKFAKEGTGKDALVIANIDVPADAEWTSIDGYAYTFNGNGYEISGLKAPLFKTASGNIKNVKLTNVAITDNSSEDVAALVCSYSGVEIVNCSVSGTITSTRSDANNSHIAGVVGHITSTANFSVEGCVNNCAINVTLSGSATNKTSYIGGVVGRTDDVADSVVATIKNCYNNAPVSVTGATTSALRIGGVVSSIGYVDTVVENCHNIAKIALGSQSALFSTSQTLRMGGVIGDLYRATSGKAGYTFSGKDCSNSGSVDIYANVSNATHIGGVVGTLCDDRATSPLVIDNFDNSGTVTINGEEHSHKLYVGGVIGWSVNNLTMSNCNNSTSGAVSINLETKTGDELAIGGLVGLNRVMYRSVDAIEDITDCDNKASVSVNISESSNQMIHCGGCFGIWFAYTTHKYHTTFKNVDNYGTVQLNCNSQTGTSMVGGIIGGSNQASGNATTDTTCYLKLINCDNIADKEGKHKIHITNGLYNTIHVAGIVSYIMANIELDNCNNSMELLFDAKKANTTNMFSGILTRLNPTIAGLTATIKSCKNSGDISIKGSEQVKGYAVYAGIFGYHAVNKIQTINITGCTNTGDIYVCDKQSDSALFCAGLCGVFRYGHTVNITDCTNEGSIDVRNHTADGLTGGLIGRTWGETILSLTNCHNKASATISHKANTTTDVAAFVGGLAGLLHGTISIKQCSNSADISVIGTATRAVTGGIAGAFRTKTPLKLDNVSNSGNIYIGTEENSLSIGTITVGGLMGDDNSGSGDRTYTAPITNTGNIILTNATITTPESSYIGGAVGMLTANINDVKSFCNIEAIGYSGMKIGMITGSARVADTVVASNCAVGGSICTSMTGQGEAERPDAKTLDATNYFNYIYGSVDWTGVDNYDGCTLEVMPTPAE